LPCRLFLLRVLIETCGRLLRECRQRRRSFSRLAPVCGNRQWWQWTTPQCPAQAAAPVLLQQLSIIVIIEAWRPFDGIVSLDSSAAMFA
jgi:hypothetical protein